MQLIACNGCKYLSLEMAYHMTCFFTRFIYHRNMQHLHNIHYTSPIAKLFYNNIFNNWYMLGMYFSLDHLKD